ncbi:MAG: hypothetical protein ACKOX6_16845, partial [Bdellovibrio sp.]
KTPSIKMLGSEKDLFADRKKIEHGVSSDMKSILLGAQSRAEAHIQAVLKGPIEALEAAVIDVTPTNEESET